MLFEIDKFDLNGELIVGKNYFFLEGVLNIIDELLISFNLFFFDGYGKD